MPDGRRLLVVDDEAVICHACRRVFSRQGFQVEECTDARDGLDRASQTDYEAILLDIKMPQMDGLQFLEALRQKKPHVPVMIMTGYPTIPNAAAAVRLGASDYITKPFTPEQITQSLQRLLSRSSVSGPDPSGFAEPVVESWAAQDGEFLFLDESWLQPEEDGSACVGAVLPHARGAGAESVRLPKVGEVVYQGLPLAGLTAADQSLVIVRSPISGVIVSVNELLQDDPSPLLTDPCGKGWIGCICTTRLEEEVHHCKPRQVILANAEKKSSARAQCDQLKSLGCRVLSVAGWEDLAEILPRPDPDLIWGDDQWHPASTVPEFGYQVLVLDAASFGEHGPEIVRRINLAAPSLKVVVSASSVARWEAEYREQRIFYYAVAPFVDNEILEILDAAFRSPAQPYPPPVPRRGPSEPVSGIRVTNRNGHKVHLLAAPGLLRRSEGLGGRILRSLAKRAFPMITTPGDAAVTPGHVLKAAGTCDRVMVLLANDTGRLPGSLVRDTKAEYVSASRENASRVTTLVVQPDPHGGLFAGFDERTTAALAEHIVEEMASY